MYLPRLPGIRPTIRQFGSVASGAAVDATKKLASSAYKHTGSFLVGGGRGTKQIASTIGRGALRAARKGWYPAGFASAAYLPALALAGLASMSTKKAPVAVSTFQRVGATNQYYSLGVDPLVGIRFMGRYRKF